MAITTKLELRQSQQLVMTPQLQQAIKLLQLSNLELNEFVDAELERNPLLERDEEQAPAAETSAEKSGDGDNDGENGGDADDAPDSATELIADTTSSASISMSTATSSMARRTPATWPRCSREARGPALANPATRATASLTSKPPLRTRPRSGTI